jgi:hypothetical protein
MNEGPKDERGHSVTAKITRVERSSIDLDIRYGLIRADRIACSEHLESAESANAEDLA